jgi:hypothetical protein
MSSRLATVTTIRRFLRVVVVDDQGRAVNVETFPLGRPLEDLG